MTSNATPDKSREPKLAAACRSAFIVPAARRRRLTFSLTTLKVSRKLTPTSTYETLPHCSIVGCHHRVDDARFDLMYHQFRLREICLQPKSQGLYRA